MDVPTRIEFVDFRSFWGAQVVVGVVGDVPGITVRDPRTRTIYLPHVYPLAAGVSSETLHPYLPAGRPTSYAPAGISPRSYRTCAGRSTRSTRGCRW